MSGGRAGVPLDECVLQIASGDPYWQDGVGYEMRNSVLRQIAAEWRMMLTDRLAREAAAVRYLEECG